MDLQLRFLESFFATGSDGRTYKVCAYERLARDVSLAGVGEHWESTGVAEYRLEDSRRVEVATDGALRISATGVVLTPRTQQDVPAGAVRAPAAPNKKATAAARRQALSDCR